MQLLFNSSALMRQYCHNSHNMHACLYFSIQHAAHPKKLQPRSKKANVSKSLLLASYCSGDSAGNNLFNHSPRGEWLLTSSTTMSEDSSSGCGRDDHLLPIYLRPIYPLMESRGDGTYRSWIRASEKVHPGQVASLSQGDHIEPTHR